MKLKFRRLFILAIVLAVSCVAVLAKDNNPRNNRGKNVTNAHIVCPEPDRLPQKSLPDRRGTDVKKPNLYGGNGAYDGRNNLHGYDVSHYQGRIDWYALAKDPKCGYVYMKATEGADFIDDCYAYNIVESRRAGIKVGSYHFFRPGVSAKAQYDLIMRVIDPKRQDLVPMIDVEVTSGASLSTMMSRLDELCRMVTKAYGGKKPLIYTGRNFYNKYFYGDKRFQGYPFMIAAYTSVEPVLNGDDDYLIWQFTDAANAKGIKGKVDMSRFHGRHVLRELSTH